MGTEAPRTQDDGGLSTRRSRGAAARQAPGRVRFVVVEQGATAFAAHVSPDESEETVVVSQFGGEAPEHLADRAAARLETVARADGTIQKAVVLLAPHHDEASRFARLALLRSVIAHTEHEDAASVSLVLGTRGDEDPALREDLLSLVDGLVTDAGSRSLPIRVCFDGASVPTA